MQGCRDAGMQGCRDAGMQGCRDAGSLLALYIGYEYDGGMPARNAIKVYDVDSYYHVYNRGVNKRKIFLDDKDYAEFLRLLKRYFGKVVQSDDSNRPYPNFYNQMDLLAYCLMPNHFHLLVKQNDNPKSLEFLMRSIGTSYTSYFNKKHKRVGHLFQGTYKASKISSEPYLLHISRYIHMNPADYEKWKYSSWPYYTKGWVEDWVKQHEIFSLFEGGDYKGFVEDYVPIKAELDVIYRELADK